MFDATELREISGTAAIADASVASDDELLADTVRVGRWLKWLPELDQAAASGGTFTADHAAEVARVANLRNLDGLAELLDQDGGHDPDRDLDANKLSITRHSDGTAHLKGQLGAADAEIVLPSLDAAAQSVIYNLDGWYLRPSVAKHHINNWRHGGNTAISNLMCLCPRHHGVVHRNNWTATLAHDATATFTTPTGDTIHTKPAKPKPRLNPAHAGPRRERLD